MTLLNTRLKEMIGADDRRVIERDANFGRCIGSAARDGDLEIRQTPAVHADVLKLRAFVPSNSRRLEYAVLIDSSDAEAIRSVVGACRPASSQPEQSQEHQSSHRNLHFGPLECTRTRPGMPRQELPGGTRAIEGADLSWRGRLMPQACTSPENTQGERASRWRNAFLQNRATL